MANRTDLFLSHPGLPGDAKRYAVEQLLPAAPTTPSAQTATAFPASNATTIRAFEGQGLLRMPGFDGQEPGLVVQHDAADDVVLLNGEIAWLAIGQERRFDRVAVLNMNGTIDLTIVSGAAALDGAGAYPTDAAIEATVAGVVGGEGHLPWMRLYGVRVRRTADAVIAVTFDYTRRPLGVYRAGSIKHTSLR